MTKRRTRQLRDMRFNSGSQSVGFSAATPPTVNFAERTIEGLIVPFGAAGKTSAGFFTFPAGSISWNAAHVDRVKLLIEHDQRESVGYARSIEERPEGIYAVFHVPEGAAGDVALSEANDRVRDAFSVGVELDDATLERARRSARSATPAKASGVLRETSLVAVPAFDDARVGAVAHTDPRTVVVAAWRDVTPTGGLMLCPSCNTEHPTGTPCHVATASNPSAEALALVGQLLQAGNLSLNTPPAGAAPATAGALATAAAPEVLPAAAVAQVVSEPPTYTFNGSGESFVRDSFRAFIDRDVKAAERVERFSREIIHGGPSASMMLAAVETRTTAPEIISPENYRGDMLLAAIDRGRPLFSRLRSIVVTDATPFRLPAEGEFDGVGIHTEGTAHVAEGTLTLGDGVVSPTAISGAYRVSRELVDASNPAIDKLAITAMIRDYRRTAEDIVVAALEAADASATVAADVAALRAQAIAFMAIDDIAADFIVSGTSAYAAYIGEDATDGRPVLPFLNPTNAVGQLKAGYSGATVDGAPLIHAASVDSDNTWLIRSDAMLVGESPVQTFRFEQPEGPGILKLALWAYGFAAVLRADGVKRLELSA